MRWADERWVGFISTETAHWARLSPHARMLFALLLRAANRLGVIALANDHEALSALLRAESIALGPLVEELTRRGFVSAVGEDLQICNFVDTKDLPRGCYVRLYTRDTPAWSVLSFEARGLFCLILRSVDRAGLISMGSQGLKALAVQLRVPGDVFTPAFEELLAHGDGCIEVHDGRLLIPNFLEAQEAIQSDASRKRAERERDRARRGPKVEVAPVATAPTSAHLDATSSTPVPSHAEIATPALAPAEPEETSTIPIASADHALAHVEEPAPEIVTPSHAQSRPVTPSHAASGLGHAQSRPSEDPLSPVTPSHSDLIRSDLIQTDPPPAPHMGGMCGADVGQPAETSAAPAVVAPPDPAEDPAPPSATQRPPTDIEARIAEALRQRGPALAALATPAFVAQIAGFATNGMPGPHPLLEEAVLEKLESALVKCEADIAADTNEIRNKPGYIITHVKALDAKVKPGASFDAKANRAGAIYRRLWQKAVGMSYGFPLNDRKLARQLWDYAEENATRLQLQANGKESPNEETIIEHVVRRYLADPSRVYSDASWPLGLLIANMGRYGLPSVKARHVPKVQSSATPERSKPPARITEMLATPNDALARRPTHPGHLK